MPADFPPASTTDYFTGLSHTYAAHRPDYPTEAFTAMLAGLCPPIRAADIGCGTGISTRFLAQFGASVIGIDPNPDMLDLARSSSAGISTSSDDHPSIRFQPGSAEHTALPDSAFSLVLCAQSFHWFNPLPSLQEFRRILHPAGRLALIWNVRDDSDPFTNGYGDAVRAAQSAARASGRSVPEARSCDASLGNFFTNIRLLVFPSSQSLDLTGLLGRLHSASYCPRSGPLREKLDAHLTRLFHQHHRNNSVTLKYRCELTLASPNPLRT